jgi:imidazolonepropionase
LTGSPGPRRAGESSRIGIIPDGAFACLSGKVVWSGPSAGINDNVQLVPHAEEFDAEGRTVTPGFVDSHTHPLFSGDRQVEFAMRAEGADYEEIARSGGGILNSVKRTREATPGELAENLLSHLSVMLSSGSTTVEAKTGYGLDHDTEIRCLQVLRSCSKIVNQTIVPTFLGAHEVPLEFRGRGDAYLDYICEEVLPDVGDLAVFVDIFCEKDVFSVEQSRKYLMRAAEMGYGLKVHADEFHDTSATGLAVELGATSADHLLSISSENIRRISGSSTVATILPGTALFLGKPYPPARKLLDAGAAVALATDFNPGSCFCESMPLMVSLAVCQCGFTVAEAIVSATANGAAALGLGGVKGSLEPGYDADFIVWDIDDHRSIPYHLAVPDVDAVFCGAVRAYSRTLSS